MVARSPEPASAGLSFSRGAAGVDRNPPLTGSDGCAVGDSNAATALPAGGLAPPQELRSPTALHTGPVRMFSSFH